MVIIRSIAEEEIREDVEREICVKLNQMMRCKERLERKMNIMIAFADTVQNEDEKKEFIASTETLKNDHDNIKKQFTDFVFSQIEVFMKLEDDKNEKLRPLCIKFLGEEYDNYLDFLSDEAENFPPLERRTNEGLAPTEFSCDTRQSTDRGKAKLIENEDGEASKKERETIKKDGDDKERLLKKLEGSSSKNEQEGSLLDENVSSNIPGLEEKRRSLMLPGASSMVPQPRSNEDEDQDGKKSLIQWLKLLKNGYEDWKAINGMWVLAIDLASNLFRLLLEFMIIMPDQEGIVEKLRTFKSTLKALSEQDDTLIVEKLVTVLNMVENEAIGKKTTAVISESLEESQVNEIINLFFELLLHLKNIISSPSLPNSIKGSVTVLECNLERCNAQLKEVESKVNELKKLIFCDFDSEKLRNLELRIVVMWDEVKKEHTAAEEYRYPMHLFLKM